MAELLDRLKPAERRGSKPRCHWITHGTALQVASRLNALITPWASVAPTDRWMPEGFAVVEEAELQHAPRLLDPDIGRRLAAWWLPADRLDARTPNFDIASTCTIEGKPGLLLVEAKAHDNELKNEAAGRILGPAPTDERTASHDTIRLALEQARLGLTAATLLEWAISRDSHYQMSNRFGWSWKLATLGVPVVLVYLGFLRAEEMTDRGKPFESDDAWDALVKEQSTALFPAAVWNRRWSVSGVPFIPLIKSLKVELDQTVGG